MGNESRKELHKRIIANLLVCLAIGLFIILGIPRLIRFFMPLIVAWIIASIANPMVRFLEKKIKIMRKHGSAIVIILVILLVGGLLYLICYAIFREVSSLIKDLPQVYEQASRNLQASMNDLHNRFHFIPSDIQNIFEKKDDKLNSLLNSCFASLQTSPISAVGSFASSLIDIFVLSILTLMIAYFFVAQREYVKNVFIKCTPEGVKKIWNMAMDNCIRAIIGYIKACFKIMIVIFFVLLLIFGIVMKSKYALVLALVTAFLDFLPFLGTGIIIAPWAVYCFITGEYVKVIVLIITYIISLLAHRLLEPKLVGDSVGMSPFATLVFMFIGYRMIGMLGLIVGIPVGMIIMSFYEQGVFEPIIRGVKILAKDLNEYRKY